MGRWCVCFSCVVLRFFFFVFVCPSHVLLFLSFLFLASVPEFFFFVC